METFKKICAQYTPLILFDKDKEFASKMVNLKLQYELNTKKTNSLNPVKQEFIEIPKQVKLKTIFPTSRKNYQDPKFITYPQMVNHWNRFNRDLYESVVNAKKLI